jgi:hypothetical protein
MNRTADGKSAGPPPPRSCIQLSIHRVAVVQGNDLERRGPLPAGCTVPTDDPGDLRREARRTRGGDNGEAEGCTYLASCCFSVVLMDQTAETSPTTRSAVAPDPGSRRLGYGQLQAAVGLARVVMRLELSKDSLQVASAEDQEVSRHSRRAVRALIVRRTRSPRGWGLGSASCGSSRLRSGTPRRTDLSTSSLGRG